MPESDATTTLEVTAPLDEVMLAMDVVDTLRHRRDLAEREMSSEARERELVDRLRDIYAGQGIVVSDDVLVEGVKALREDRFVYSPPSDSFAVKLARIYVRRSRWGRWVGGVAAALLLVLTAKYFLIDAPAARERAALPESFATVSRAIESLNPVDEGSARASELAGRVDAALDRGEIDVARAALDDLARLRDQLEQTYEVRVVQRQDELSGVWRIPDVNTGARNHYLVVEAIAPDGSVLELPITSEENGTVQDVRQWGLRVDERTYDRVAADKQDDGIIQGRVIGAKSRGELTPRYTIDTSGAAITEW